MENSIPFRLLDNKSVTLDRYFIISLLRFLNDIKENEITFMENVRMFNEKDTDSFRITLIQNGVNVLLSNSSKQIFVYVSETYIPYCIEFKFTHFNVKSRKVEGYKFTFPIRCVENELYIDGICRVKLSDSDNEQLHCSYYHRNEIIIDDECFYDEGLDIYEQKSYYFPTLI